MTKKQNPKIIKETNIPVRVIKTSKPPAKTEEIKKVTLKKPAYQKSSPRPLDEKSKGLLIVLAVIVIMSIIVTLWSSFLKYNLKKPGQEGQSLWGEIRNNLTNSLSGLGRTWQEINNIFSSNTNKTGEQELENKIFPEIKSNTNQ
jgi:hypothetical protein